MSDVVSGFVGAGMACEYDGDGWLVVVLSKAWEGPRIVAFFAHVDVAPDLARQSAVTFARNMRDSYNATAREVGGATLAEEFGCDACALRASGKLVTSQAPAGSA